MNARISATATATPQRQYEKGEKRYKHVGKAAEATIDEGNPAKVVGKCPNNITDQVKLRVLKGAIAELPAEANEPFPSRMFAVHDGVIYDCRTTTLGKSYHAFPYHREMLRSLRDRLAQTQDAQANSKAFKRWIAKHVKLIG